MENVDKPETGRDSEILSACSACAGDYEDPDRTAPVPEMPEELAEGGGDEDEDRRGGLAGAEGFLDGEGMPQE